MSELISSQLPSTGERFLPEMGGDIEVEHVHRYLAASRCVLGMDVLDIASGEGYGSNLLALHARNVIGVDISAHAVEHARVMYTAPNLRYEQGSCSQIPLPDGCVDAVVSFETIEHHAEHDAMLNEIRRVLKPSGFCIISSPNKFEYSDIPNYSNEYHVAELYSDEFEALLSRNFSVVRMYGQSLMRGSLLEPLWQDENIRRLNSFAPARGERERADSPQRSVYFIAVAGNATVPALYGGFYEAESIAPAALASAVEHRQRTFLQLYWGTRAGEGILSERNSTTVEMPLDASLRETVIQLPVCTADDAITALRLDPSSVPAVVTIRHLSIEDAEGNSVWEITAASPELSASADTLVAGEKFLRVTCLTHDPQLYITLPKQVQELSCSSPLRIRISGNWQAFFPDAVVDIASALGINSALHDVQAELAEMRSSNNVVMAGQQAADHRAYTYQLEASQATEKNSVLAVEKSGLKSEIDALREDLKASAERLRDESSLARETQTRLEFALSAVAQSASELDTLNAALISMRQHHDERLTVANDKALRRDAELFTLSDAHSRACQQLAEAAEKIGELERRLDQALVSNADAARKHDQAFSALMNTHSNMSNEFQTWRQAASDVENILRSDKLALENTAREHEQIFSNIRSLLGYSWIKAFNKVMFSGFRQKNIAPPRLP